jgi:glucose-1-phosphate cytidylyltransferase
MTVASVVSQPGGVKIVVLCGGRGSRLRPLTDLVPKPLVEMNGKPILHHLLQSYIRNGYSDFVLCVGYRGDMIREFVEDGDFDAGITVSDAGDDASMLQRLHGARDQMPERIAVAYGDTLIAVDMDAMLEEHIASGASITITVANVRSPFGLVDFSQDGLVASFEEKPLQWFYVGHMIVERRVLDELDPALLAMPDGEGLVALFQRLITQRKLRTHSYVGPQITFNTRHELAQAERDFNAFFTHEEESR